MEARLARIHGRWAFGLCVGALVWSLALIPIAIPGSGVFAPVAVPALASALMWSALHRHCTRGTAGSLAAARVLVIGLTVFAMVGWLTAGFVVAPVAGMLAVAVALTPPGGQSPLPKSVV